MKRLCALLLSCLLAAPALAAPPVEPAFKDMDTAALKAYYDEGAFTSYRDAMKELIARGELKEIHDNLRTPHPNRSHYMSAWAVAWMQPPEFEEDMAALLDDIDPGVRFYAVYYLGSLHKAAYAKRIGKLLADPSPEVRHAAVSYFGVVKLVEYRAAVARLANDSDAEVRKQVEDTLKKLSETKP
jgi:hypothetical protein